MLISLECINLIPLFTDPNYAAPGCGCIYKAGLESLIRNNIVVGRLSIATEWEAFRSHDFEALKLKLKNAINFDGGKLYDPAQGCCAAN